MRDGRKDNHASQIYMKDDTLMCEPQEANYVQRYHEGYHDQNSKIPYSYQNRHYLNSQNKMPQPSRYFELPKTSSEEMMREWMARQAELNERMKNQEDKIKPILTMPNPNQINSNSPTISPFLKDCTVHIPYTNAKTFVDVVLLNHVGDKELNSIDGVGSGVLTKKQIKKDDMGLPKEPNKEWKLNEKSISHNK
ncbi:hypothetical protein Tco_1448209 [Tanacetum coccineum]